MPPLSSKTFEAISTWSEALTALFGILAATSAVVFLLVSKPLKAEADRAQEALNLALEQQKEKTANAEIALHRLQEGHLPRSLLRAFHSQEEIDATMQSLRNTLGHAEILFAKGDAEARWLAEEVFSLLHGSDWQVTKPKEVPTVDVVEKLRAQPLGVTIVAKTITEPNNPQYIILRQIFTKGLDGAYGARDLDLPPNLLRIVIMPRP